MKYLVGVHLLEGEFASTLRRESFPEIMENEEVLCNVEGWFCGTLHSFMEWDGNSWGSKLLIDCVTIETLFDGIVEV